MAKKASDHFKTYVNANSPTITTVTRPIIEKDGLYFKDIDGTGKVSPVNDWRLSPEERAAAYVKELTVDEKIAQLFISDWRMGPKYPSGRLGNHVCQPDESGCVDEAEVNRRPSSVNSTCPAPLPSLKSGSPAIPSSGRMPSPRIWPIT